MLAHKRQLFLFVDLEIGKVYSLVLYAIVGTVILVCHLSAVAPVEAELVTDVRCPGTPKVYMPKTLVDKCLIVADALHFYPERTIVLVEHLRGNLNPLVFEIAQRQVVYDYPLAALPCVACVNYLNAAVVSVPVTACAYRNQRCAVVALLGFQLVDVAEFCAWAEMLRQLELPLQDLRLADVAVQMLPFPVCLAFHLVPLAVVPLAPVAVKMFAIGMNREAEHMPFKFFVEDDFAVLSVGVVIFRRVGVFGVVPPRCFHKGVYRFVVLVHQFPVCT